MTEMTSLQLEAEAERVAALRMEMLEMHPFWGYLLLQVRLVQAPHLPILACTDLLRHIWYNPELTSCLNTRELGFVLAHEICHQVLEQFARCHGRDEYLWNQAMDYAINSMINDITIPGASVWGEHQLYQMTRGALFNANYHDCIAEVIYEELCHQKKTTGPVEVDIILPGDNGHRVIPSISDHGGGIDIHLPIELDDDQRETLRDRIVAAVEVFHANSDRGNLPVGILRNVGIIDPPKIPWQRVLHHYCDTVLNGDDYSLAHPNKHYWHQDLVVPGHYDETICSLVVALDTSGSMSDANIRKVAKEIRGLVPNAQDVTLIVADCDIQQVVPLDGLEEVLKSGDFLGGGGTDHICVFDYIAEHHLNPRIFIGMTDLNSSFPEKKPPYPVLWLVPEKHGIPPWGKVIVL